MSNATYVNGMIPVDLESSDDESLSEGYAKWLLEGNEPVRLADEVCLTAGMAVMLHVFISVAGTRVEASAWRWP